MQVFVDDQPVLPPRPTLAAALAAGREAAHARGRVVVEAARDGKPIPDAELDSPTDEPFEGEIRFVTAEPRTLVQTTLLDVADGMDELREIQIETAQLLQTGQYQDAFAQLSEAVGVWDTVRRVVEQGPALLNLSIESLRVHAAPRPDAPAGAGGAADAGQMVTAHIDALSRQLTDLKAALGARDWSSLADQLEGEMDDASRRWEAILRDIAAQLAAQAPGAGASAGRQGQEARR